MSFASEAYTPLKRPAYPGGGERNPQDDLSRTLSTAIYGSKNMRSAAPMNFDELQQKYHQEISGRTELGREIVFAEAMMSAFERHHQIDLAFWQIMERSVSALIRDKGRSLLTISRQDLALVQTGSLAASWRKVNESQTDLIERYSRLLATERFVFRVGQRQNISLDSALMGIFREDLQYRMAEQRVDGVHRKEELAYLDERHVENLRTLDISAEIGHLREHRVIQVLRERARELDHGHLFGVQHALPFDDFANGIDLYLDAAGKPISVSIKTRFYEDTEFRSREIGAAREGSRARLVWLFPPELLEKAAAKNTLYTNKLIGQLLTDNGLHVDDKGLGALIGSGFLPEKPSGEPIRVTVSKIDLGKAVKIPHLVRLGLLAQNQMDAASVEGAKQRFLALTDLRTPGRKVFEGVNKGDLKTYLDSPQTIASLRSAFEQ